MIGLGLLDQFHLLAIRVELEMLASPTRRFVNRYRNFYGGQFWCRARDFYLTAIGQEHLLGQWARLEVIRMCNCVRVEFCEHVRRSAQRPCAPLRDHRRALQHDLIPKRVRQWDRP